MKAKKTGKRHTLILYRHSMDRLWPATFLLSLLLGVVWWQIYTGTVPIIETTNSTWLLVGAVVTLVFSAFAFLGRFIAYAQPRPNHLRLTTPFLRLNISYRRVRNVQPTNFSRLFPPEKTGWAERSFLAPFYGQTMVRVSLFSYPVSPRLLKLFLPRYMFSPRVPGLLLLVPDWLALSAEMETFLAAWRQPDPVPRVNIHTPFAKSP